MWIRSAALLLFAIFIGQGVSQTTTTQPSYDYVDYAYEYVDYGMLHTCSNFESFIYKI